MLAVFAQVVQHTVQLLLLGYCDCHAAQRCHSCLVQLAVGPGSTEQAAMVICCKALQDINQALARQCEQQGA
jgi:hypothetical protein